jgi:hypothetical protein
MRGGVRAGAGRKQVLTFRQRLQVGQMCETLQEQVPVSRALAEWERQPEIKKLRGLQARAKALPTAKERNRFAAAEIKPMFRGKSRVFNLPVKREFTRQQIIKRVSGACRSRGLLGVTPRRIEACWKEFCLPETAGEISASLISARVLAEPP